MPTLPRNPQDVSIDNILPAKIKRVSRVPERYIETRYHLDCAADAMRNENMEIGSDEEFAALHDTQFSEGSDSGADSESDREWVHGGSESEDDDDDDLSEYEEESESEGEGGSDSEMSETIGILSGDDDEDD